jgi:hypothetical protein
MRFWQDTLIREWFDTLIRIWGPDRSLNYFPFGLFADISTSQPSVTIDVFQPLVEIIGHNAAYVEIDASEN